MLLGITGKDFVILAASKAAMRGPTIIKAEDDKTRQLNKNTLMAYTGEAGDTGAWNSSGRAVYLYLMVTDGLTQVVCDSAICRIHPSEHSTIHDAERYRTRSECGGQLCAGRIGAESEITESLYVQPFAGRNGADFTKT